MAVAFENHLIAIGHDLSHAEGLIGDPAQLLYALGLPLAIVPLLFLATSVVQPAEGPFVAGIVDILGIIIYMNVAMALL